MAEEKKNSSLFITRGIGITGILSLIGAMYFVMITYNQVGINESEIKSVEQGLHNHIGTVENRLSKKIGIIESLEKQGHKHEIEFLKYQLEAQKQYYELKIEVEVLKAKQ